MDLKEIAKEIREILEQKRIKIGLTFEEESHKYTMKNILGEVRDDFPSVSKVIGLFYEHFDSYGKSLSMCNGDTKAQKVLLEKWKEAGDISTNMGSRVHYILENKLVNKYIIGKIVREPIYECGDEQIKKGDNMVIAGERYIEMMERLGCVLLDTETVMGSPELGYTGQPDKIWLYLKNGKVYFIITDWKTNQPKNFLIKPYTNRMYKPFEMLPNNSLGHYSIQLPFYGKLLVDMLKGSKYENIEVLACVIVLLKKDSTYSEYRIDKKIIDTVMDMKMIEYLN